MEKEIVKLLKKNQLKSPNVLFLTPEDLAFLREELGLAPEVELTRYNNLEIIVIEEDN